MTITGHPLHRSGRALLTHPAPALGDDAKASQRISVMQRWSWQPAVKQTVHALPRQARLLAATPERAVPVATNMITKRTQRRQVRRHTVITIVSRHHRPQPLAHFSHALVHSFAKFRFDSLQLSPLPLAHRAPPDREHPVASLLPTDVREAKKVECLRLPLSSPFSPFGCIAAKLNHPRFLGCSFSLNLAKRSANSAETVRPPTGAQNPPRSHQPSARLSRRPWLLSCASAAPRGRTRSADRCWPAKARHCRPVAFLLHCTSTDPFPARLRSATCG